MKKANQAELLGRISDLLASRLVSKVQHLQAGFGDVPPDAIKLTPEEKAKKLLPDWFVRGQDTGQVGKDYWKQMHDQTKLSDYGSPAKNLLKFDSQMRDLHQKYPEHAVLGMSPQTAALYGELQKAGSHPGHANAPEPLPQPSLPSPEVTNAP